MNLFHCSFSLTRLLAGAGLLLLLLSVVACGSPQPALQATTTATTPSALPTLIHSPTPPEPRLLSICIGQEPGSLFVYGDASQAARSIRAAIYDGPVDIVNYQSRPAILTDMPSISNGGISIETVQVISGTLVADPAGVLVKILPGASYLPAGCLENACAQQVTDQGAVQMDQLVVRFKLLPGLRWSDGVPLTAADSVYSYDVAKALFPRARAELLRYTAAYQALDETTIEWRGVPGYRSASADQFIFSPLPRHAWSALTAEQLLTAEQSTRSPLGWGAYTIESWVSGDHLTLAKNPNYYRSAEGLPYFDRLVYRFISDSTQALQALMAGECDLLDETALADAGPEALLALQQQAGTRLSVGPGSAWEHIDFNITSLDANQTSLFAQKEVRQAVALCIDRQALVDQLFDGQAQVMHTYLPPAHPLSAADIRLYPHDPAAASALLDQAGWVDLDGNPQTPRTALGVAGIQDGVPFEFAYQTISGTLREQSANLIALNLAECGLRLKPQLDSWENLFAPGPQGPAFGRSFQAVQFAWMLSSEPGCELFTSQEIPGPYPEYPRGWGGANLTGYSNPEYDRLCAQARAALPGSQEWSDAHRSLQVIFAEDLPVLPLYQHPSYIAARQDVCGILLSPASNFLWNLESLTSGTTCTP